VTSTNYLVPAQDVAAAVREAFQIAQEGRPGPVLIDITKDAQQSSCEFDWEAAAPGPPRAPRNAVAAPGRPRARRRAHPGAKRPVILAGHGVTISGAENALRAFAERGNIPVAQTLLGIGGSPPRIRSTSA
jgi:acetolactate synthase-1/2/3 large subunit